MKHDPPHRSQPDVGPVALLFLSVLLLLAVVSMAGGPDGGVDSLDRPLKAPAGLGL